MAQLTIELLTDAVAGGAVALRSIMRLRPADGPGGKVFPPTYAVAAENKYAVEERQVGDRVVTTVLLDSVASQANRAELALLEGWEAEELSFPVPYVDFTGESDVEDLGRITVLEAPHRLADAIFRDSLLGGTLFRLSDVGRAITEARPGNATDLFRYAPTALLFGQWDSTGPKGGLGSKFQRAYVSEIVGLDAQVGRKVGSRIDPLQIEKASASVYEHANPDEVWTLDEAEAAKDTKGKAKLAGGGGRPSEINHGNIAPSIDSQAGGVTISEARQTAVLSLAALRRLRFAGESREAEVAARTAVAALGVAAIAYGYEADHDLRSRCLLIPQHPPVIEMVGRDGGSPETVSVDRESAARLVSEASARAARSGIPWERDEIVLRPAPKLIELLRRSREVSAREPVGE
ncbi:MAG: type I-U CRISPR-associated protein Cas7 [Acidimicrobiaceae bacterium]|nr:type I-U CRISPR-associated protein Cas7 [Acidimicrobiaceae bacterium]MYB02701.1 type I-U CRISPR-associated protein Cas7 [Acidimicrobiaceae bacterium]MYF33232.1 type I-U CRISPR-associated protein Cas7 [Acidimicrobiaceae bacterium]MYH78375.1 type I-U CRISPR-associated protein Cas7 [Acidimicrobiaceae bacterium]MYK76732.1 type I-U CRISPR-associated protein Cas7 [Acidimicrobiaceae bacterium]